MLRPDTERLWGFLKPQPALGGFILVGGTALAMHLGHRTSEDLDFMAPTMRLPRGAIEALKRALAQARIALTSNDSPQALAEFEDTGLDYADYQQDYIADGSVKLTFVAPDTEVRVLLRAADPKAVRVASIEEIFRLKCIACANRSKTRDWLDLYVMLTRGLFQPIDIYRTFELAGHQAKYDIAMARLCSGKPSALDEGYASLLPNPPTLAEMAEFFRGVRDRIEVEAASGRGTRLPGE